MTNDAKLQYVLDGVIPALLNDMRLVAEAGCRRHGIGTGPSFTLTLLCLVACETIGALSPPIDGQNAPRRFIARVGEVSGDPQYQRLAGLLFAVFRHGIGHSFLPKQAPRLAGQTIWNTECLDDMMSAGGALGVHTLRTSQHLMIRQYPEGRRFQVLPKILCIDVMRAIDAFADGLRGNAAARAVFFPAFDAWYATNELISAKDLTASEQRILDDPIEVFR
jgi:hypothetical protein